MDNPVHNGICLRSAAEPAMPFIDRILSNKDGGMIPTALFKQLIEVLGIFFGKFVIQPLIKDKELIVADPFPVFRKLPEVVVLILKVTHQVRHPDIQNPVSLSARFHAKGACKVSLSSSGRSCDDKICCIGNKSHCGQIQDRGLFYLSGIVIQ